MQAWTESAIENKELDKYRIILYGNMGNLVLMHSHFGQFYKVAPEAEDILKSGAISVTYDVGSGLIEDRIVTTPPPYYRLSFGSEISFSHIDELLDTKSKVHFTTHIKETNPFRNVDELLSNEEKVHLFISHIGTSLAAPYKKRLAKRIKDLFDFTIEDEADSTGMSADSLHHFIAFLQNYSKLKYPDVVLSPEWNIVSEWHIDSNHHFSVDFLPNGDVRFVIFRPNPKKPKKTDRFSGMSTSDCLYEIMKNNGVLSWAL